MSNADSEELTRAMARALLRWMDKYPGEDTAEQRETMRVLGLPNSKGFTWARVVTEERDLDNELKRNNALTMRCIIDQEKEKEHLRELLRAARGILQHHKADYPDEIDNVFDDDGLT